uniref:Uncharacterized protein n=1 Tax=Globodera rostochiensis TaxID=31243 RepID=A0A914I4J1_GLORO
MLNNYASRLASFNNLFGVNASTDNVCFLTGTPKKCQAEISAPSMVTNCASVQLTLVNGCPFAIFVAGAVQVNLTAGATEIKNVPKVSSAQRLWANTDCDKPNNALCSLSAAMPPISLFEWTFDADGKQTYDVSYVDGANVPISVQVPNCPSVTYDTKLGNSLDQLADTVPEAMKMVDSNGKKRVKSVCLAYGTDSVCCRNSHNQPETCGPTHGWTSDQIAGYNAMRAAFPTSYSYAYDDRIATEPTFGAVQNRHFLTKKPIKMMRIKEAIQRRKLIQQLNDEYLVSQIDSESHPFMRSRSSKLSSQTGLSPWALSSTGGDVFGAGGDDSVLLSTAGPTSEPFTSFAAFEQYQQQQQREYLSLAQFVGEFNAKLSDGHRRALRVTWNRLTEPPKTSGRGMLKIMEKIFENLMSKNPEVKHCFYRSAFVKCLMERKQRKAALRKASSNSGSCPEQCRAETIVTVRDHAHLMIELIDGVMCILFDVPFQKPIWDPATIGRAHARLIPFGFDKKLWHSLGEVFAEVMFCQDCVRAYPLAASAWSMFSVALTDKMFHHTKMPRCSSSTISGDWSKQSSLSITAEHSTTVTAITVDAVVQSLSHDLQQRALISLQGNTKFAGGSAASSFRHRKLTKASLRLVNDAPPHARRASPSQQHQRSRKTKRQCTSSTARRRGAFAVQRLKRSPSVGANALKQIMPITAATVANLRLCQAPAFFSRTVSTSLGGMPSTSLGESSSAVAVTAPAIGGATTGTVLNNTSRSSTANSGRKVPVQRQKPIEQRSTTATSTPTINAK